VHTEDLEQVSKEGEIVSHAKIKSGTREMEINL